MILNKILMAGKCRINKSFNACRIILFLLVLFGLSACASRIPPSGGPKDSKAPEIVSSIPANGSTGFGGDVISFNFSEYVQLKDGGSGILVSPPLNVPPQVLLKGKTVQMSFREKLHENTTYSITIGKSVVDLTEGNALQEHSLVFSTGASLDSLSIKGAVADAFTAKPVASVLVMLYPALEDSLPEKTLPVKLARTDGSGKYQIDNIRQGTYMVFALKDENNNYKYDLPEEKTGFLDSLVVLTPRLRSEIDFRISVNPEKRQRLLKKSFNQPGKVQLKYAVPVSEWRIQLADGRSESSWTAGFVPGTDSLIAWIPRPKKDSLVLYSETVSDGKARIDTLVFLTHTSPVARGRKSAEGRDTSLRFNMKLPGGKLIPDDTLTITASRPLLRVDPSRFHLLRGKDTIPFTFPDLLSEYQQQYVVSGLPASEKKHKILAYPGAFTDVYGMKNDTLFWEFQEFLEDELGIFSMLLKGNPGQGRWVWELVDKSGTVVLQSLFVPEKPLSIDNLIPGTYTVRLFRDENANNRWDHGNFYRKLQPEQILHYQGQINVRAGWDIEQTWELQP